VICASLGRGKLHLGRRMPRAELLWPVHYLAYAQRGRTVRDGAGEQLTGYSAENNPIRNTFIKIKSNQIYL